jgi:flavin-binding protein dodecin
MTVVKIIRLVGNSPRSWEDAAGSALREAARTLRNIQGIEATDFTAKVDGGRIREYRCTVNIAFLVGSSGGAQDTTARATSTASGARKKAGR